MVTKEKLIKKIEEQVKIFKSRSAIGCSDGKRHDLIRLDEQTWMFKAHNQLGWSFTKIGSVFLRDPRSVENAIKKYEAKKESTQNIKKQQLASKAQIEQKPYQETQHKKKAEEVLHTDDPLKKHFDELSETALALADNFDKYLDRYGIDFNSEVGDVIYGGWLEGVDYYEITGLRDAFSVKMQNISKSLSLNLLSHLKEEFSEFPELSTISDWTQLTSGKLTYDLIARLKRASDRGNFAGECEGCPN